MATPIQMTVSTGRKPPIRYVPSPRILLSEIVTGRPLHSSLTMPRMTVCVPSVAIMGGTCRSKIMILLTKPQIVPITSASSRQGNSPSPRRVCASAIDIQVRPAIAPPEISMPAVMMIAVWATARTPTIAPCFSRFVTLYRLKKFFVKNVAIRKRATMINASVNSVRLKNDAFPAVFASFAFVFMNSSLLSTFDRRVPQHVFFCQIL